MDIKKENIIRINKGYGQSLKCDSSLDFAIDAAQDEKSKFKKLALVIRAIVVDHCFTDANKRTTIKFVANELRYEYRVNKPKLTKTIKFIAEKNIIDLNEISRRIRRCTKPIKKNL